MSSVNNRFEQSIKATVPVVSQNLSLYLYVLILNNLVPRVSSLLYLYSWILEAVRQCDWLFAILRGNSVLRWVNGHGMSKFHVMPYSLSIPTIICNLFPKFEEYQAISLSKLR